MHCQHYYLRKQLVQGASYGQGQAFYAKRMLPNCFTCPHEVVQHIKHLLNGRNQEMELFSGTNFLPDLEVFSETEGVQY